MVDKLLNNPFQRAWVDEKQDAKFFGYKKIRVYLAEPIEERSEKQVLNLLDGFEIQPLPRK